MGEKSGWSYIEVPADKSEKLMPGSRKSFRVKGMLDEFCFELLALIPMGDGNFILPLNAQIRKAIRKQKGDVVKVIMQVDLEEIRPPAELIECL